MVEGPLLTLHSRNLGAVKFRAQFFCGGDDPEVRIPFTVRLPSARLIVTATFFLAVLFRGDSSAPLMRLRIAPARPFSNCGRPVSTFAPAEEGAPPAVPTGHATRIASDRPGLKFCGPCRCRFRHLPGPTRVLKPCRTPRSKEVPRLNSTTRMDRKTF